MRNNRSDNPRGGYINKNPDEDARRPEDILFGDIRSFRGRHKVLPVEEDQVEGRHGGERRARVRETARRDMPRREAEPARKKLAKKKKRPSVLKTIFMTLFLLILLVVGAASAGVA